MSGTTAEIAVATLDRVDLLFVVNDAGSIQEEQYSLVQQFPRLIELLTTGDRDGDGTPEFAAARDLHLGVVSTDMGAVGVHGLEGCDGHGDDGILLHAPSPEREGCQASYPPFLSYSAESGDADQAANDLACVALLGTEGCGFEQPLEAALKALWPSVDPGAPPGGPNRIHFLGDENGFGTTGHGDEANAGFLRNDPAASAITMIVVLTDEDDCSSTNTDHLLPADQLPANDPRRLQDLRLRCYYNPENLYPIERYINGYKALHPGNEQLVMFSVIAGVPPDLVELEDYVGVDWADAVQRDGFYTRVLADSRMQEQVDPDASPLGQRLVASCDNERGLAFPPLRLLSVARGFGRNGSIHSICNGDLEPALTYIAEQIASQLGASCLPRPLVRGDDGLVACDVEWELPPPGAASPSTPTRCGQSGFEFLRTPGAGRLPVAATGGAVCSVAQLPVEDGAPQPRTLDGTTLTEGWYYDDFSDAVRTGCIGGSGQRVSFSPGAHPPAGVTMRLHCLTETAAARPETSAECSAGPAAASERAVGKPCLPSTIPEDGFDDSEAYLATNSPECGGGVCLVYRLAGDPDPDCDPASASPEGLPKRCPTPDEVEARVYCSCRCDAPDGMDSCDCPDGFSCIDVLEQGGDAIAGGYCVRNGTFTSSD